ncbi:iron(III) transport system ATP-binding protein [Arthrobacter sp. 1088]|uniref:ABC transporter ATP-binding protein n=1 Tax=Arthrobacter sp. 1088 TaxID=2817768 RepID=UPI00285D5ED5|nr:ABC transporter ATP-binding protein [Arthrobacter sp. 1088]MDR6687742.1 iron(III) transport system ATP-binding protein [Arthrobacter sp. 1088]
MITFANVEVRFGDFIALPDYELTVEEGEFFTLLGPSGCGKSTALRSLAGFIQPSRGDIIIGGKRVTHVPSHRREVGMVFQSYALFPTLSVWENIAFGLKVAKVSKDETDDRVRAIARQVNLSDEQLAKSVTDLSGGQQQRVAIARALVLRPKILLLDEPLSNLDAKLRHQLRAQLKELQQQFGITTVYVTHDQDEALTMSDRIAVMNDGRIEQVGTPQEVYTRSATEFVCNFVGDANKLSRATVDVLMRGSAARLDPDKPAYVRIEKVRIEAPGPDSRLTAAAPTLAGRVRSRHYHGVYSSYRVETETGTVRGILQEDGRGGFQPGDHVRLLLDPADILQYEAAS